MAGGCICRSASPRIYPLYGLLTLATFALLWHWHSPDATPGILLLNLSLLRSFFDEYKFSGIGAAWSLTLFECFYFAEPVLLGLRARGMPLWLQPLLLLAVGCGLVAALTPLDWHGLFGSYPHMLMYTFFGHSLEFFVGVWLAGRYRAGHLAPRAGAWLTGGGVLVWVGVTAALAAAAAHLPNAAEQPITLLLNLVVLPLAGGLLLAGLLSETTWPRRLLSSRWFEHLGRSSYAFYLLHAGPLSFWIYERLLDGWLLRLLVVQAVSYVVYQVVEEPLVRWFRPGRKGAKLRGPWPS